MTNRAYAKNNGVGLLCSILWYMYNIYTQNFHLQNPLQSSEMPQCGKFVSCNRDIRSTILMLYIFTVKFSKSRLRNFQTFQSGNVQNETNKYLHGIYCLHKMVAKIAVSNLV
jgi:hypothetical protein